MGQIHEYQAQRIVDSFAAHNIQAKVWKVEVAPRFYRYTLTCAMTARVRKVLDHPEDVALNLGVKSVRIFREGGSIIVEVPRDTPREVSLPAVFGAIDKMPPNCAVLGIESSGSPLLIRLDSPDVAHIFIAGTTGSGKTEQLRMLLLSLALTNNAGLIQFALIDPKGNKFTPLATLPHIWRGAEIVTEPSDAALLLAALVAEMERRARGNIFLPRIIVAIDELADLIKAARTVKTNKDDKDPITDPLERLTQRGREHGIHVVAATQRPAATMVGGMVKANFPVRIVGSVVSPEDAKVAAGIGGTGAERLLGRGDCILVAKGSVLRFQGVYNKELEYNALVGLAAAGQEGRKRRAWTQFALEQGIREAREVAPRTLRPLADAVRDLVPALVQRGGAPVHQTPTHANSLPVDISRMSALPVHRPAPPEHQFQAGAQSSPDASHPLDEASLPAFWRRTALPADATPAQQRGALPRRPAGPTPEDAAQIKAAHPALGSLNKTCEWAYGSKSSLTMSWVKAALMMPVATAADPAADTPAGESDGRDAAN